MIIEIIEYALFFICLSLIWFSINNRGIIRIIATIFIIFTLIFYFWEYNFYHEMPVFLEAHGSRMFRGSGNFDNPINEYSFGEVFKHFATDWFK